MCFPIGRNAIIEFGKNMSQRPKGFQGKLDTTIIKNSSDWFCNYLNIWDYYMGFYSGITVCIVAISQSWTRQTIIGKALRIIVFFQNIGHIFTLIFPSIVVRG